MRLPTLALGRLGAMLSLAVLLALSGAPSRAGDDAYTPKPGSAERKAIMDAMRAVGDVPDRKFVVRHLKVQSGWAWLVADPQSADGKSHYERETALLADQGQGWTLIDQPCAEEGCDAAAELARIRAAHPEAPEAIFP